jgi:hypothetical protein
LSSSKAFIWAAIADSDSAGVELQLELALELELEPAFEGIASP